MKTEYSCRMALENPAAQTGLSDNVGRVKFILSTLRRALQEERHFALVDGFALPTAGSLGNRFRSGTQSDPCISSIRNCDHDYYFELLFLLERSAASSRSNQRACPLASIPTRTC